jgi:sugar lactone lactonase YvrE
LNVGGYPTGITRDDSGSAYGADFTGNRVVEVASGGNTRVDFATGLPGSPESLAFDTSGHLWVGVADQPIITKLNSDGTIAEFTIATEKPGYRLA